jgi:hypothetical protein
MSKFEINSITIELIRAILRFRFSFLPPKREENNILRMPKSLKKISQSHLTLVASKVKINGRFFQNFVSLSEYLNCNKFDDNSRPIIGEEETAGSIHDAYFVNKKEGTHTLTDVSTIQFVDISFFRSFLSICGRSQRRAVVV